MVPLDLCSVFIYDIKIAINYQNGKWNKYVNWAMVAMLLETSEYSKGFKNSVNILMHSQTYWLATMLAEILAL